MEKNNNIMRSDEVFDAFFNGKNSIDINFEYIEKNVPEFNRLKGCKQPERWHMEGDAYEHTMKCLEWAYFMIENNATYNTKHISIKRLLLLAVLFHDIGKPDTTFEKNGVWHSYGHDSVGEKIVRRVFWDEPIAFREKLCSLVKWHMEAYYLITKGRPFDNIINASFNVNLEYLMFVHTCDIQGSITKERKDTDIPMANLKLVNDLIYKIGCNSGGITLNGYDLRKLFYKGINPCIVSEDDDRPCLYIMIGLPGSGKDSFVKSTFPDSYVTLCRDDIRAEMGYCKDGEKIVGTNDQENNVTEIFNARLIDAIKSGKNVVINNINLKKKYREGYANLVKEYNPIIKYIYIEAPSIDDNYKRREGQISKEIFDKMLSTFEWPSANEPYDDFRVWKQKYDNNGNIYLNNIWM